MTRLELDQLIEIAKNTLASENREQFLGLLDQYTDLLDPHVGTDFKLQADDKDQLTQLSDLHAQLLERANDERQGTQSELRGLHKRGQGILAYADVFPKRVSSRPVTKG